MKSGGYWSYIHSVSLFSVYPSFIARTTIGGFRVNLFGVVTGIYTDANPNR